MICPFLNTKLLAYAGKLYLVIEKTFDVEVFERLKSFEIWAFANLFSELRPAVTGFAFFDWIVIIPPINGFITNVWPDATF
jgi:hypothetical protein